MIKFQLACERGHEFEAWFASGDAFERQARRKLIVCPACASRRVSKQPMAPAIVSSKRRQRQEPQANVQVLAGDPDMHARLAALRALKNKLLENSEDVGQRFAEEARKMHFGESDARAIHGEASLDDAKLLHDDGVAFGILPQLPDEQN